MLYKHRSIFAYSWIITTIVLSLTLGLGAQGWINQYYLSHHPPVVIADQNDRLTQDVINLFPPRLIGPLQIIILVFVVLFLSLGLLWTYLKVIPSPPGGDLSVNADGDSHGVKGSVKLSVTGIFTAFIVMCLLAFGGIFALYHWMISSIPKV